MSMAAVQSAWRDVVPLVRAQKLATSGIFTHTFALDDAPAAYAQVAARSPDCVKALLTV
jgi:threonine dehydrogenase-like Zn-dependent dehydrogenase